MGEAVRTEKPGSSVDVTTSTPSCKNDKGGCPYHGLPPTDTHSNAIPPIAVVGMAMRLPGNIRTSNDFWDFVMNKKDGHGRVPPSRYEVDSFYNPYREGGIDTKHGYFLTEDPACFDAGFFGIPVDDASHMDPQQRLLMEVVWECLESSGETGWEGKDIGCYVGVFGEDWLALSHRDPASIDKYHPLCTGDFAFSNIVSYTYDLRGPSMTIKTGCSSALVGLHEACQSLVARTCSSAIVAGTNLILTPTMTASMGLNMVLSPSGICRTFDAEADGYGRGEAVNALYIKRLDDALLSNDPIRAVIRSTAANCDGKTANISSPSIQSQKSLIQKAYERAAIEDLSQTALFECHGTGTITGDAVECSAIEELLGPRGTIIGAVKPNFGHSEGASGITSVIKAVLSLEHATIAPNTHFRNPNPSLSGGRLTVPCHPIAWPADRQKRVSINSFGIGGSNAHLILDSADGYCPRSDRSEPSTATGPFILILSAGDPKSLQARARQVTDYVKTNAKMLPDLAFTLAVRRRHLTHRAFAICNKGAPLEPSDFSNARSTSSPRVTFAFSGQGAQWIGMGNALMETYESFREDLATLDQALRNVESPPSWSLKEELSRLEGSRVNEAEFCQPLTTAIQIGLVNLLAKFGVRPTDVIGHSSGEIAAAYASGAISANSAIVIAYYRGILAKSRMGMGEMASIGLSGEEVGPYLVEGVSIACQNSPRNVTISGDKPRIDEVLEEIKARMPDVFCKSLRLNIAYHSHHMKAIGPRYEAEILSYVGNSHQMLPMFSSVVERTIINPSELSANYWRQNLENPVLFANAIDRLLDDGNTQQNHIILEVGPHPVLSAPIKQTLQTKDPLSAPVYAPTLVRYDPDCQRQLLSAIGNIHIYGANADLFKVVGPGRPLTDIPPYPWNHETKCWKESRVVREWRLAQEPYHELLGLRCTESTDLDPTWRILLSLRDVPWLSAHVLQGQVIFPGAGYIAMAGEAIRQLAADTIGFSVKNVIFRSPLMLDESGSVEIITTLRTYQLNDMIDSSWFLFTVSSHDGTQWVKNCTGKVRAGTEVAVATSKLDGYARRVSSDQWYDTLSAQGLSYGSAFKGLQDITADPSSDKASAQVNNRIECHTSRYAIHPTMIDQCLQAMSVAGCRGISRRITTGIIPASIEWMEICQRTDTMDIDVDIEGNTGSIYVGNATAVTNDKTTLVIKHAGFVCLGGSRPTESQIPLTARIQWMPDIHFQDAQALLPPVAILDEAMNTNRLTSKLALLYILETARVLKEVEPQSSHMAKWKHWILKETTEGWDTHQKIIPESANWGLLSAHDRRALIASIKSRLEVLGDEHAISAVCMERVYDHCLDLMAGSSSTLDLLMDESYLARFYANVQNFTDWSQFLRLMAHSNPRLRILEVGAGTGSATAKALEWLHIAGVPMYSQYVFTDISSGFLGAAQERFKQHRGLEYEVLDIAHDPLEQGFSTHTFDLVIASNVLHATPVLKTSLLNVRKLLAPEGRLLLHDLDQQTRISGYILGTLPGWWVGEGEGRVDRPYISPDAWNQELQSAGFTGTDAVRYDFEPPFQLCATILSQVAVDSTAPSTKQRLTLVTGKRDDEGAQGVAAEMVKLGHAVELKSLEDPPISGECIVFLMDVKEPFLYNMGPENYRLLQEYLGQADGCTLIWVTGAAHLACDDPRYSLTSGFVRTLRADMVLELSIVEMDSFGPRSTQALGDIIDKILAPRDEKPQDLEHEFSVNDGVIHIGRCYWGQQLENASSRHSLTSKLDIRTPGLFDTLQWVEAVDCELEANEVEVKVCYIGLNFKDIMVAMGLVGHPNQMGIDGVGIVRRVGANVQGLAVGDRVFVLEHGVLRTHAVMEQGRCTQLPEKLSMEDAATMISAFATVIYSLVYVAHIRKDQSILIHSACGGVGLAAIQVCQMLGVEKIFATVGNADKREHLVKNWRIPENHIFNSRDTSFLSSLMQVTGGRGADVVLNSLSGELLHASWACVAPFGKMIELGKRDLMTNSSLDLKQFLHNRAFFGVDMGEMDLDILKMMSRDAMQWYTDGKIQPIRPITVFEASDIVNAFRHMQAGAHMGKVLIQMPDDSNQLDTTRSRESVVFPHDASYLLVGGLGGLGRAVSTWMVENGARSLVYLSRFAGLSEADQEFVKELELMGCGVQFIQGDVVDINDVRRAVSQCPKPLKGVLHMALSLNDCPFPDMSFQQWQASLAPKAHGALNLHHAVSEERLDFFVMFSSTVGVCGNISQANYAAGNTFLDGLAQYRRQRGLPASTLALGAVGGIGLVSRDQKLLNQVKFGGIRLLNEAEVLEGLQRCLEQSQLSGPEKPNSPRLGSLIVGLSHTRPLSDPQCRPLWYRDARFRSYYNLESFDTQQEDIKAGAKLKEMITNVEGDPLILPEPEMEEIITQEIISMMAPHLANSSKGSDESARDMVIDSLMAIEAKNWLRRNLAIEVTLTEISKARTVAGLAALSIERLKIKFNVTVAMEEEHAAAQAATS